jgi:hypothetical protein
VKQYRVSDEELVTLAKTIFEAGCYGYMDLQESICAKILTEFTKDKEIRSVDTQLTSTETVYTGHGGPEYAAYMSRLIPDEVRPLEDRVRPMEDVIRSE